MSSLTNAGHILVNSEFLEVGGAKNKAENLGMNDTKVKSKIAASIHKLANKKGDLVKVKHEGRGYAYALKGWVNPNGRIKPEFTRKK